MDRSNTAARQDQKQLILEFGAPYTRLLLHVVLHVNKFPYSGKQTWVKKFVAS